MGMFEYRHMKIETANINDLFETSDFGLAASINTYYLLWAIRNDHRDPSRKTFVFKRDDGLDEFVQAYWRGEIRVEPRDYENKRKELKTRIYQEQNDINID
jgi:hypothetical protein